MKESEFSSKSISEVVKPASRPEKAALKVPRSIKFHDKTFYNTASYSTAPNPAYSAVTFYNMPGFLIG